MARRLPSIGLAAYKNLLAQNRSHPPPHMVKIVPSAAALELSDAIALSNSILVKDRLPDELESKKFVVPAWVEKPIVARFEQLGAILFSKGMNTSYILETLDEKNFNAQTVQSHLNLVKDLVPNKISPELFHSSMTNFGELIFAAPIKQKHWIQVTGRADFAWSCRFPLDPSAVPSGTFDMSYYNQFMGKCDDTIAGDLGQFEAVFNQAPYLLSGFRISDSGLRHPLNYPAVDFCIEYKRNVLDNPKHFEGQCVLYLLTSSVAYAYWRNVDRPFKVIGVVSDGERYTFLVFQLNTLNFDVKTKVKNVLWRKETKLFDRSSNTFCPAALEELGKLVSLIIDAQQQVKNI